MTKIAGVSMIVVSIALGRMAIAQESARHWDIAIWIAGATGEELTNSFAEAQLWSSGIFVGRMLTSEVGRRWWRGQLEYGFEVIPVFVQSRPQLVYGGVFKPVELRWNSAWMIRGMHPYVELAGGGLRTTSNLPSGDTSDFNFTVQGGGGIHIAVRNQQRLEIGCSWYHVSNANLGRRNPEFNGIEIRIGYHWMK